MPIINSLLDSDTYKFSMGQCVLHQFPGAMVEYEFKCRTPGIDLVEYIDEIKEEVKHWCSLRFTEDELKYLSSIRFMKPDYIEYLRNYQPNYKHISIYPVTVGTDREDTEILAITIRGPWVSTIYFEVPVLAIVSEVYMRHKYGNEMDLGKMPDWNLGSFYTRSNPDFKFCDFGTRRRFSYLWHDQVIQKLKSKYEDNFTGTSNVLFAKNYNLTPIGTMAHEFLMATQAMVRISDSQKYAFQKWAEEYRGDLGIALSDVVGMNSFLKDFDLYFSKLFDGARHDSGNPVEWCDKLLDHYDKLKIDSHTKKAVFSDGLDFDKAVELHRKFKDRIQCIFGIGTYLTNSIEGCKPIQIVIKMTHCNGQPVAKISDSRGKQMCTDQRYLEYLGEVFNIPDFDIGG